ncbi:MAG: DUF1415 domain-containing protein [Burkholderiales bacterium]|nr:DUF1415 domain-containing protein [Burkholderiales bacterium]
MTEEEVVAATQTWLDVAVIGLNLCPFARAVRTANRIRFVVSTARNIDALFDDLQEELKLLAAADPAQIETTLLIAPNVLGDFLDFNDFLDVADEAVAELELDGEIQVASFHPDYRFAETAADDVTNCTNRSPFPTLHLLREESVERAIAGYGETSEIFERNGETLRKLGWEGWRKVMGAIAGAGSHPGPPPAKPGEGMA